MTLTDAELAALESGGQQIGVFFRLAVDPVVRLWLGIGPIKPGVNALDVTNEVYKGFGELGNAPAFKQLLNGAAERVDFVLSGVSTQILGLVADEADSVRGVACDLGYGIMGQDWQLLGPVRWARHFDADFLSVNESESGGNIVRSVVLSVGSQMTGNKRVGMSFWSSQDQQRRHPTPTPDKGCDRAVKLSVGQSKSWGVLN